MYQLYYCNCIHYNYVATMLFVLYYYSFITTIILINLFILKDRRLQFSEIMLNKIEKNNNFRLHCVE